MIKKEDIKVGLRFYITRNDCLKCNFDPIGIHGGSNLILFNAERKDADVYICTSVSTDYKYFARFREEDIMMFGTKLDIVTKGEGKSANEKTDDDHFKEITNKMFETFKAKNHDYGSSFSNLFKECGMTYAYGHMAEKLERVKSLMKDEAKVNGESMRDSLLDLANYAILTIMELDKTRK